MASVEAKPARALCSRCARPLRTCYCSALPPQPLSTAYTRVVVLQHANEQRQRQAISSVPVLTHVMCSRSVVVVPVAMASGDGDYVSDQLCAALALALHPLTVEDSDVDSVLVLFPHPEAKLLDGSAFSSLCSSTKKSTVLIAVDGTWAEAKRIVHHSRRFWASLAARLREQRKTFEYVCLVPSSADGSSIYGELRKEPMPGCVSTLEAVAMALKVLEPSATATSISDALCTAFQAMVAVQTQFLARGRAEQQAKHGGTPKPKHCHETSTSKAMNPTGDGVIKTYVFYTTQTDLRKRQRLLQEGESRQCTRDEALAFCAELNHSRKRGNRVSALPLEAFERQQQQQYES